jgi:hypothetical protein
MEQQCSYWTDFLEILHVVLFEKSVERIQVLLKSDNWTGYFTGRPTYIYDNIMLISFWDEKFFGQKL